MELSIKITLDHQPGIVDHAHNAYTDGNGEYHQQGAGFILPYVIYDLQPAGV
jgi:hypothetical protein